MEHYIYLAISIIITQAFTIYLVAHLYHTIAYIRSPHSKMVDELNAHKKKLSQDDKQRLKEIGEQIEYLYNLNIH